VKVALVHDYCFEQGGAENVVEVLLGLFPGAPLYTSIYDPPVMADAFRAADVRTSFLQHITRRKRYATALLPLYPLAYAQFDLRGYDLVLSSASSFAKGVRVPVGTLHLCYCHRPARFLWLENTYLVGRARRTHQLARLVFPVLRRLDYRAAQRVDAFIANSAVVARRIARFYHRTATVIHPPIHLAEFAPNPDPPAPDAPYLILSRLVGYKRVDLAVQAANQLQAPLLVVGDGPDRARLEALAGPTVRFTGRVPRAEVRRYLQACRALLFPGEEDFGLTPLEAMASGRPVVAYAAGGALETVVAGSTGVFFQEQTAASLVAALESLAQISFSPQQLRAHAARFDVAVFTAQLLDFVTDMYAHHRADTR
jgi:glycosyltransferase involved in cell wall biosynthesis